MSSSPSPAYLAPQQRGFAIAAISLGSALTAVDGTIATVALPTVARELSIDNSAAVLIVTVYQLMLAMLLLPFSALGDRIGLNKLFKGGLLVFLSATALCFFAHDLWFLLVVRGLQATGAAAALSVIPALIYSTYPLEKLGRGFAISSLVASISGVLAPVVGGLLLRTAPWPLIFASAAPFALLSLCVGWNSLPEVPARTKHYNVAGALLNMATFGSLVVGIEMLLRGVSPFIGASVGIIGLILGIVLVKHERRSARPILPIDLLLQPILTRSTVATLFAFIASMMLMLSLPFRLQHGFGYSPSEIGAVLMPWPLATMIVAFAAGILSDRYPAALLGGLGMLIAAIALVLLAWLPASPTYFDLAWRMGLCGTGFGLFIAPNSRLIVGSAPRDRAAAAGGLIAMTRPIGQTVGATCIATLFALGLSLSPTPPLIAAGLAAIACACSFASLGFTVRTSVSRDERDSR